MNPICSIVESFRFLPSLVSSTDRASSNFLFSSSHWIRSSGPLGLASTMSRGLTM